MASGKSKPSTSGKPPDRDGDGGLPLERSVGYQVRMTHRALQRYLQIKIKPHGVTLGTWYFLRALWHEDGLTQRELSRRIGTREPTTMTAILAMEANGLVRRVRNDTDRRKQNVFLTPKGRRLKIKLVPLAAEVVNTATTGLTGRELALFLGLLGAVQRNLEPLIADETGEAEPVIT